MYLCSSTKIFIKLILIEIYYIFQYRDKLEEIKRIRSKLRESGCELPPLKPDNAHFDSNCITPVSEEREKLSRYICIYPTFDMYYIVLLQGTPFMANLAICLQYYIHDRMNNNPVWKGIKVSILCTCIDNYFNRILTFLNFYV